MRRSSVHAEDSSSDEAYNGVDLISDSEEDEPDVEEAEEQAIIESENDNDDDLQETPRPTIDDGESWEGFEFDRDASALFEAYDGQEEFTQDTSAESSADARHVHFDLSDSDSVASFDETFPDFIDKASLDPVFPTRD